MRLSLLDLAMVRREQTVAEAFADSVTHAQTADRLGCFERLWFAEHHNMPSIASAATSVLISHVAARTERIRVGAGGVMLPNHSPLIIAEQYGTLAELYPGRIDLGLGRASGTDQATMRALRVDPRASDHFPNDILELQQFLGDGDVDGIRAVPGRGTKVPLYILGSSLFGAKLAARLGLPYAFASHFAPDALRPAIHAYRTEFRPSEVLAEPYAIAACNVIAADSTDEAQQIHQAVTRSRVRSLAGRSPALKDRSLTDDEVTMLLDSPIGAQAQHMMHYTAVGDGPVVSSWLEEFQASADADEVMVATSAPRIADRLRTLEIIAAL